VNRVSTRSDITGVHRARRGRRNRRSSTGFSAGKVRHRLSGTVRGVVPWVMTISVLAAVVVVVHFGWEAACTSERLQIGTVEFVGNSRVPDREVQAYTGITIGDSIMRSDLDEAALNLRRHPWIRTARVLRQLPNRIVIEVEEHQPEVVVALAEPYLASVDGELFKRITAHDGIVLPVVTGIERDQAAQDSEGTAATVRDAIALAKAMRANGVLLGRLDELHWDRDLGWSVVTRPPFGRNPLRVHLGFDAEARISVAVTALESLKATGRWPEALWVDGVKHPRRAHARLRTVGSEEEKPLIAKAR